MAPSLFSSAVYHINAPPAYDRFGASLSLEQAVLAFGERADVVSQRTKDFSMFCYHFSSSEKHGASQ